MRFTLPRAPADAEISGGVTRKAGAVSSSHRARWPANDDLTSTLSWSSGAPGSPSDTMITAHWASRVCAHRPGRSRARSTPVPWASTSRARGPASLSTVRAAETSTAAPAVPERAGESTGQVRAVARAGQHQVLVRSQAQHGVGTDDRHLAGGGRQRRAE